MIAMMERYTNNLEDIVAERTEQLQEEKIKTDALLYRMLPKYVRFFRDSHIVSSGSHSVFRVTSHSTETVDRL